MPVPDPIVQTVELPKKTVEVHAINSTLTVGDNWQNIDNFVNAKDNNGRNISFDKIKVTGNVDTSKEGNYQITYSIDDPEFETTSNTITVTVVATPVVPSIPEVTAKKVVTIIGHNSKIILGSNKDWSPFDNFDSAVDNNGNTINYKDLKVSSNVMVDKTGRYEVTYQYINEKFEPATTTVYVTVVPQIATAIDVATPVNATSTTPQNFKKETTAPQLNELGNATLPVTGESSSSIVTMIGLSILSIISLVFTKIKFIKNNK